MTTLRNWPLFACEIAEDNFRYVGELGWVLLHYSSFPIVPVAVQEDPEGLYWGFLRKGLTVPSLIQPSEIQFRMCFPGKPEDFALTSLFQILRLTITHRALS